MSEDWISVPRSTLRTLVSDAVQKFEYAAVPVDQQQQDALRRAAELLGDDPRTVTRDWWLCHYYEHDASTPADRYWQMYTCKRCCKRVATETAACEDSSR